METYNKFPILTETEFFIDNSSLNSFRTCRRLFQLHEIEGHELVAAQPGRNFGSGVHAGLAARYRTAGTGAINFDQSPLVDEAIREYFEHHPQPPDDFRTADHAMTILDNYNDSYQAEDFEILQDSNGTPLVEKSFALPFATLGSRQVYYCGRIDIGIRNHEGTWSFDHKTAFMFGDIFECSMQMDPGQRGYVWALQQVTGIKPIGYVINAIRVRRPTKKATEYDTPTAPVDSSDFLRIPFYLTDDEVTEWKEDALDTIADILATVAKGTFRRDLSSCTGRFGKCDFYEVCSTARRSRSELLSSSMFTKKTWSPLNKPNESIKL